jgi:hypothetical protein
MSADFEQAIALGATYIRVGTALFGKRAITEEKNFPRHSDRTC